MEVTLSLPNENSIVNTEKPVGLEQKIRPIINSVDNVLTREYGEQRIAGTRAESCGISSYLIQRAAQLQGLPAHVYQAYTMHSQFSGTENNNSFRHSFAVIGNLSSHEKNPAELPQLVDLTFTQFLDAQTARLKNQTVTYTRKTSEIIQALVDKGSFPLTDENFREYLRITTFDENPTYIQNVTASSLLNVTPLNVRDQFETEELDEMLFQNALTKPEKITDLKLGKKLISQFTRLIQTLQSSRQGSQGQLVLKAYTLA